METGTVTIKGQIVIPAKIRKRLGLTKGSTVCFIEGDDEVVIRPLTKNYFEKMAGTLGTQGKLGKSLLAARKRDRVREDVE